MTGGNGISARAVLLVLLASKVACGGATVEVTEEQWVFDRTPTAIDVASGEVLWAVNGAERGAELSEAELETRLAIAEALIDEGEYEPALGHLELLVRARPTWWSNQLAYARGLYYGVLDLEGALDHVDACIALEYLIAECHELRGMLLNDLGRRDEAYPEFKLALEIMDETGTARQQLARLYLRDGHFEHAREVALPLVEEDRRDIAYLLLLATIEERGGRADDAEQRFVDIARFHRDRILGLTYLLRFYQRNERTTEATAVQAEIDLATPQTPQRVMRGINE